MKKIFLTIFEKEIVKELNFRFQKSLPYFGDKGAHEKLAVVTRVSDDNRGGTAGGADGNWLSEARVAKRR